MNWDVVVVGAGPGGLAASAACARAGLSTLLVDESPDLGGQIWRASVGERSRLAHQRFDQRVEHWPSSTVFSAHAGALDLSTPSGPVEVPYQRLVLATGARELMLPFPGWTLPGVFGVGGLQAMVKSGLDLGGKRVVLGGSGPLLLAVAVGLAKAGADVVGVFEQAGPARLSRMVGPLATNPNKLGQALSLAWAMPTAAMRIGWWIAGAEPNSEGLRLRVTNGRRSDHLPADAVGVGYGLVPNVELALLLGCEVGGSPRRVLVDGRQQTSLDNVWAVGEAVGIGGLDCAVAEGLVAAAAISGEAARLERFQKSRDRERRFAHVLTRAYRLRKELADLPDEHTVLCRCEDVLWGQVAPYRTWREAKLQTRCGMGVCQGRICGAALRQLKGFGPDEVRPPLVPMTVLDLARLSADDQ